MLIFLNRSLIWNTKKTDGWKTFETLTKNDDAFQNLINVESSKTTGDMAQIEKKLKKVKFSSFGKVKIRAGNADRRLEKLYESKSNNMQCNQKITKIDSAINNRILEIQKEEFEKEVENILTLKKTKGCCF